MNTFCPKCKNTQLIPGIAIDPGYVPFECQPISPWPYINSKTLKVITVLKCPKCGYSDDGKSDR